MTQDQVIHLIRSHGIKAYANGSASVMTETIAVLPSGASYPALQSFWKHEWNRKAILEWLGY